MNGMLTRSIVYIWSTILEFVLFLLCTCWLLEGDQSPPNNQNKQQNMSTYQQIQPHAITHHTKIEADT